MINWTDVTTTLLSTGLIVAGALFIGREVFKSMLSHVLYRRLEDEKHQRQRALEELKSSLEAKQVLSDKRRSGVIDLLAHLSAAGWRARDIWEAPNIAEGMPPKEAAIAALGTATKALEDGLYENRVALSAGEKDLYVDVHALKNRLIALKMLATSMRSRVDTGNMEKARVIGDTLSEDGGSLQTDIVALVERLTAFAIPDEG
ncbi:MAG: hypothetical protein AAF718_10975 [Pseudomonadota bacterium]